jgi:hypothetical protein
MSFADMVTALFADPVLSKAAVYQPQGSGQTLLIRVMAKQPDTLTGFGDGQIHAATSLFDVQAKDMAQPAVGDQLTVGDIVYVVQSEPTADRERLIWTLNVREA